MFKQIMLENDFLCTKGDRKAENIFNRLSRIPSLGDTSFSYLICYPFTIAVTGTKVLFFRNCYCFHVLFNYKHSIELFKLCQFVGFQLHGGLNRPHESLLYSEFYWKIHFDL
jgi:hypothetical protein